MKILSTSQGIGFVSPLVLLEKDGGAEDPSHAVWMQTNFFVGAGDNKGSSFINVALGEWDPQTGITGFRRGGSTVLGPNEDTSPQTYSFSGDVASLAGPDSQGTLSHFMGSDNPNIVIGADSTGSGHNIFRDTPLNPIVGDEGNSRPDQQSGATYHVGIGAGPVTNLVPQTSGTFTGYAAGIAQHPGGNSDIVANFSPSDVTLSFDAATNTMTGSFKLKEIAPSTLGAIQAALNLSPQFNLGFGGNGRSAFIDNGTFAAIEASSGSSVSTSYNLFKPRFTDNSPEVQGFLVSADAIKANEILFPSIGEQKRAFCHWGARTDYQQHNGQTATADVPLGWWIAGNVVPVSEMPTRGTATYLGDAISNVTNSGQQYTATGEMSMGWDFGKRSGLLTISNFDSKTTFSGVMFAPGRVQFSGPLAGSDHLIGAANGAFVGNGGPQGVIGNFGVGNSTYQATGIFGGVAQPH